MSLFLSLSLSLPNTHCWHPANLPSQNTRRTCQRVCWQMTRQLSPLPLGCLISLIAVRVAPQTARHTVSMTSLTEPPLIATGINTIYFGTDFIIDILSVMLGDLISDIVIESLRCEWVLFYMALTVGLGVLHVQNRISDVRHMQTSFCKVHHVTGERLATEVYCIQCDCHVISLL